jgi:hypothetical protein
MEAHSSIKLYKIAHFTASYRYQEYLAENDLVFPEKGEIQAGFRAVQINTNTP